MKEPDHTQLTGALELRRRARQTLEDGAVTSGYRADRTMVVRLLNEALATELVCMLRYRRHHFMAQGLDSKSVADEFLAHSIEEQGHADEISTRPRTSRTDCERSRRTSTRRARCISS